MGGAIREFALPFPEEITARARHTGVSARAEGVGLRFAYTRPIGLNTHEQV